MTAKDLVSLQAAINAAIPDNTSREVDPVDVRATGFIDSIDSLADRVAITPQMFGGVGDSDRDGVGTDDSAAVQAAADFLNTLNATNIVRPTLLFPRSTGVGYLCNTTITVKPNIHVQMDVPIIHGGGQSSAGLIIGEANSRNDFTNLVLRVTRPFDDTSDWTDEASTGIRLINCNACDIHVHIAELAGGFTIGLQCFGFGSGFQNNIIRLGVIFNNRIGLDINSEASGGNPGFTNENLFFGGRFSVITGVHVGDTRIGVRFTANEVTAPVNLSVNDNILIKPNFELKQSDASPGEALPVLVEHGQDLAIDYARNESNGPFFARILPTRDVFQNRDLQFSWFHTDAKIDDQSRRASTKSVFSGEVLSDGLKLVFDSGAVHTLASYYDGTTDTHIPDCHVLDSTVSDVFFAISALVWEVTEECTFDDTDDQVDDIGHNRVNGDNVFFTTTGTLPGSGGPTGLVVGTKYFVVGAVTDAFQVSLTLNGAPITDFSGGSGVHSYNGRNSYLEIPGFRGLGRFVDTTSVKQFVVSKSVLEGFPGLVCINAFDSDGLLLLDEDDFTVDDLTNEIIPGAAIRPHSLVVGDSIDFTTTDTLPGGLEIFKTYFVISTTATRFKISLTLGGAEFDITAAAGVGVQTYHMENHYIKGIALFWVSGLYGGCWREASDTARDTTLTCRDEVKHIDVLINGGAEVIRLRRFTIHARSGKTNVHTWIGYEQGGVGKNIATTFPTAGTYLGVGSQIWQHVPAAASSMGWMLVAEGPDGGTWADMPNLA